MLGIFSTPSLCVKINTTMTYIKTFPFNHKLLLLQHMCDTYNFPFLSCTDTFCQSFSKPQDCGILDQLLIQLWICVLKKICKVAVIQDKYFSSAYGHKDSCILHIYMYVDIKHVCAVHYIVIHSQIEIIYKIQWTAPHK